MKLTREKIGLFLIILMIAGALSYFFLRSEGLRSNQSGDRRALAQVKERENQVRAKREGDLSWQNVQLQEKLYLNDQIYTDEASTSVIEFNSGSQVEMAPKTLLKIGEYGDQAGLDLLSGFVAAKIDQAGGQGLRIKSGDREINIKSNQAQLQVSSSQDGGLQNITLLEGSADIQLKDQTIQLKKNQNLNIDQQGKYEVLDLDITLVSPLNQQVFYGNQAPAVSFEWQANSAYPEYQLQVAATPDFSSPMQKITTQEQRHQLRSLPFGTWFWKVEGIDAQNKKKGNGPIYSFALRPDQAPELLAPAPQEVLRLKAQSLQERVVDFSWKAPYAQAFAFEIQQGDRPPQKKETSKTSFRVRQLKDGSYRWRVRVVDPARPNSPWSEWSFFTVTGEADTSIPSGLVPENGAILFVGKQVTDPVQFSWQGDPQQAYLLQISPDENFERIIGELTTAGNKVEWFSKVFGTYFWRVAPLSEDSPKTATMEWSPAHKIQLHAQAPGALFPQDDNTLTLFEPGPVILEWEEVFYDDISPRSDPELKDFYELQIAQQEDFSQFLVQAKTITERYRWKEPQFGEIYWRARAIPQGSDGAWSRAYRFKLEKSQPITPPYLLPVIEVEIQYEEKSSGLPARTGRAPAQATSFVKLEWPRKDYVKFYRLEIYRDKKMQKLIHRHDVEDNLYFWRNPPQGVFYLRIAVMDKWDQLGEFSPPSRLIVKASSYFRAPELIAPGPNKIHQYGPDSPPQRFSWSSSQATSFFFELAPDPGFNNPVVSLETGEQSLQLLPSELNLAGPHYWRVTGKRGEREARSEARSLQYEPLAPVVTQEELTQLDEKIEREDEQENRPDLPQGKIKRPNQASFLAAPSTLFLTSERVSSIGVQSDVSAALYFSMSPHFHKNFSKYYIEGDLKYVSGTIDYIQTLTSGSTQSISLDYSNLLISSSVGWYWRQGPTSAIGIGPGLGLMNTSTFSTNSASEDVSVGQTMFYAVGAKAFYDWRYSANYTHSFDVELMVLQMTMLGASYHLKKRITLFQNAFINLGGSARVFTYGDDNSDYSLTEFLIKGGLGFYF